MKRHSNAFRDWKAQKGTVGYVLCMARKGIPTPLETGNKVEIYL